MTPETKARQHIDRKLEQAGWIIQDMRQLKLSAGLGVAVREYPTASGPADYLLFVNRNAVGVIEAKKDRAGANLTVTEAQTERICLPLAPVDELKEITRLVDGELDRVGEQVAAIDRSLKQSAAQRQNILRAAFAGQLVPQDPNDEPASVLLERIRAERAARDAVKAPRSRKARETSR